MSSVSNMDNFYGVLHHLRQYWWRYQQKIYLVNRSYKLEVSINIGEYHKRVSFCYDFFSSLTYSILRKKKYIYTHKYYIYSEWIYTDIVYSVRILVNGGLSVVKFEGSQKLYIQTFSYIVGVSTSKPHIGPTAVWEFPFNSWSPRIVDNFNHSFNSDWLTVKFICWSSNPLSDGIWRWAAER